MIDSIKLQLLRNGEFLQFMTNFSKLVGNNNPTAMNVLPQYAALNAKVSEIEPLFKMERASSMTQDVVLHDERRDRAIIGLTSVVEGFRFHFNASVAQSATLLASDLLLFGKGIAKQNYPAETASLNGIITDWETKPELIAALVILGLVEWKNELKTANQDFDQKYLERTQEYGAANPDTLKEKRDETTDVYYELRKYLDAYSVIQNNLVYEKTNNELNALIEQYNTLLNGRVKEEDIKPPTDEN